MNVCVFCASSSRIDDRYLLLADEVGAELARRGHGLVTGGGSVSCMGAVSRAARAGGAPTVGVIPRALMAAEVADHEAGELVITADMRSRKGEMDRRSDAFLVLPGGLGTLEELLEVWTARTLGLHDKPVVLLDPFDDFAELRVLLEQLERKRFVRSRTLDAVVWTDDVPAALDACEGVMVRPHQQPTSEEVLEAEP